MPNVYVGSGSYTTTLPLGAATPSTYNGILLDPKVSANFIGAIPTNDWASSIVFPKFADVYSSPMFAGPVNMKADANGFNVGYTATPDYYYWNDNPQNVFKFLCTSDFMLDAI